MNPSYDRSRNFIDADDFIDCFNRGCELQFDYDGKSYSAVIGQDDLIHIWEVGNKDSKAAYDTAEALLDYPISTKHLRDILQDMEVTDRTVY